MESRIEPLKGKYYGTHITVLDGPAKGHSIQLWFTSGEPSKREIESWGYTQEDWDKNIIINDGWGGNQPIKSCDFICDSHYECKETYRAAEAIVEALKALN